VNAPFNHLDALESEAIHILREAGAQFRKPVFLYSAGKDSTVVLHLARKAFWPGKPPFPLLHVDTTWEFDDVIQFRDKTARETGLNLIVHVNEEGVKRGVNPIDFSPSTYTDVMKTEALKQALDKYKFDAAIGGARRDEEPSRAKERVFSVRSPSHRWDPRKQRPEMWHLLNGRLGPGETMRIFPLSNWTEHDVWRYIVREKLDLVPLYLSAERKTYIRDGQVFVHNDGRVSLTPSDDVAMRSVRFRTLGCWPVTAAVHSNAATPADVLQETLVSRVTERQGRLIDHDALGAMERKKQEGYF
jgi:sulfate adenylyltransferase subunit 2